jgi:Domain of unknown function (DUF397)
VTQNAKEGRGMRAPDLSRATWRKSRYSNGSGGSCVEIAVLPGAPGGYDIAVRDSKDPRGPALTFTACHWRAFIAAVKAHDLGPI